MWRGHATAHGTRMFATMYGGATTAARAGLFRRDPSMGEFYFPGTNTGLTAGQLLRL